VKPAQTQQAAPEAPVRVEFRVQFSGGPKGRRQAAVTQPPASPEQDSSASSTSSPAPEPVKKASLNRVPKIIKLLVLGHHFENLIREGVVKHYAEIARLTGLSRARVTQVANLTLLAPSIQEDLLIMLSEYAAGKTPTDHRIRLLVASLDWKDQQRVWTLIRRPDRAFALP